MQLSLGQIYADKYRIVRLLGEGAMGAVYEAENTRIRRRVAIKLLHPQIAQKADTLRRFEREAQAAGRIGSLHIVEVLDFGELPDGSRFMVLEYLEGTTLEQRIRSRGRLTPEEATPIVAQLLEGLGAAHRAEIIHRDLKPANVYLCPKAGSPDFVKILDFGVSKFNVLNDEMSMTSTGAVLGTPYYMSPEQAKGSRQVDPRSDLYAVGVILYECITGQVPFSAETFNELIFRIVLESPPPVESFVPNLDPAFAAIIHKAMAREADARFQTADEFRSILLYWGERAAAGPAAPVAVGASGTLMMDSAARGGPALDLDDARTLAIEGRAQVAPPPWSPGSAGPTGALPAPRTPPRHGPPPAPPPPGFDTASATPLFAAPPLHGHDAAATPLQGGEAPAVLAAPYAIPKQSNGAVAFVGALLAVLVIGGGVVALVKWKSSARPPAIVATTSTPTSTPTSTASAAPSVPVAAPVHATPSSEAVVELPSPEPTSAVVAASRPGVASRPAPSVAAPKSKATAAPAPSGKRTISNEL